MLFRTHRHKKRPDLGTLYSLTGAVLMSRIGNLYSTAFPPVDERLVFVVCVSNAGID